VSLSKHLAAGVITLPKDEAWLTEILTTWRFTE